MVGVGEVLGEAVLGVTNVTVLGHLAASCPGNENGGRPSALAFNPDIQ